MIDKCSQCGLCCRLFLVNLAEEEYQSGKYRTQFEEFGLIDDFYRATACGANILKQKENGNCIYLKGYKCSIHKRRPQVCREFFCTSKLKKFRKMIEQTEKKRVSLEKRKDEKVPDVTYEDIGGLDDEISKVREMIELPLKHPEILLIYQRKTRSEVK